MRISELNQIIREEVLKYLEEANATPGAGHRAAMTVGRGNVGRVSQSHQPRRTPRLRDRNPYDDLEHEEDEDRWAHLKPAAVASPTYPMMEDDGEA